MACSVFYLPIHTSILLSVSFEMCQKENVLITPVGYYLCSKNPGQGRKPEQELWLGGEQWKRPLTRSTIEDDGGGSMWKERPLWHMLTHCSHTGQLGLIYNSWTKWLNCLCDTQGFPVPLRPLSVLTSNSCRSCSLDAFCSERAIAHHH